MAPKRSPETRRGPVLTAGRNDGMRARVASAALASLYYKTWGLMALRISTKAL